MLRCISAFNPNFRLTGASFSLRIARETLLLQLLDSYFLDLGLPDLIRHPCRRICRLIYLHTLSLEYMNLLCASLSEPDISNASVGCF